MFDTVIVPLDGSPHAEFAIPYAIEEAKRHQAKMVLVHVIPRPEPCTSMVRPSGPVPWQGEWPFEDLKSAKRDAQTNLRDVVARFSLDLGTTRSVLAGDPGVRIAAEAKRHKKPLVVMLTGDSTRNAHPPLSLVANSLLSAGAIPVLGIRQPSPSTHAPMLNSVGGADAQPRMNRPDPVICQACCGSMRPSQAD